MDLKLSGSVALVTGGTRGIGRAIAVAFAREGANVVIAARDEERIRRTVRDLASHGVEARGSAGDLQTRDACRAAVQACVEGFGRVDVLVNNASADLGATSPSPTGFTERDVLSRVDGKALPAIMCSQEAVARMKQGDGGRVLFIGGTSARSIFREGDLPTSGSTLPHSLGNAALAVFSRHLSEEGAPYGITSNVVHPHIVRTDRYPARLADAASRHGITEREAERALLDRIPSGSIVEATDLAPLVLFLASPYARMITGQTIAVDGGALPSIQL